VRSARIEDSNAPSPRDAYMQTLREAHREANLGRVMCRGLVSVDPWGWLYDCDFNQMLRLPLTASR